jgi:predicted nucleotidyltransferase
LTDVPGVRAAFVFGSTARGTHRADSDVDLFVLEDSEVDRRRMLTQLAEAGLLLGREVNAVRYTPESLAERLGDPSHAAFRFVRDALTGPKRWVAGDPTEIAAVAEAARIPFPELAA